MARFYANKTVVITGASSGLGEAFARQLSILSQRHNVPIHLVLSARSIDKLKEVAASCTAASSPSSSSSSPSSPMLSSKVLVLPLDLSSGNEGIDAYKQALDALLKANGLRAGVDVLINNAGVSSRGTALETTPASLRALFQVNFFM